MTSPGHCLSELAFDGLLAGRMPNSMAEGLFEHIEACLDCSAKLATRLQGDELLGKLHGCDSSVKWGDPKEVELLVKRLACFNAVTAKPMRVKLTVTAGPFEGREFEFEGHDTFTVGRSARCHFQLDDKYFSRVHFLIEMNPPQCKLMDLGSRNGTLVNGTRVEQSELHPGDSIKAGHTRLRFDLLADIPGQTARTLTDPNPPEMTIAHESQPDSEAEMLRPEIAGYRIDEELGRGGMGVVYRAMRESDGAEVAIKTIVPALAASKSQIAKFLREAEILRELDHPRIVRFLDAGEADGVIYLAMEYVRGFDLAKFLKEHGPLNTRIAVRTTLQLLSALEFAHERGFVHRDIKPGNLLLEDRGDGKRGIKVADFGLARAYDASQISGLTLTGDIGGTVDFMPPEQIANFRDVTPAADQFSAAATLYRLLTNQSLYDESKPGHPLMKVLEGEIVPLAARLPDLPGDLVAIVMRGLSREPSDRFANVTEFREALLAYGR